MIKSFVFGFVAFSLTCFIRNKLLQALLHPRNVLHGTSDYHKNQTERIAKFEKLFENHNPHSYYGFKYSDVEIIGTKGKINGWYLPNENSNTTIILVHGTGNNRGEFLHKLNYIKALGTNLLVIDLADFGTSEGEERGVAFGHVEWQDVLSCVAFVRANESSHEHRVVVWGHSGGGSAAVLAGFHANEKERRVDGVISSSTFTSIEGELERLLQAGFVQYRAPKLLKPVFSLVVNQTTSRWIASGLIKLVKLFHEEWTHTSPQQAARELVKRNNVKLLILHGTHDGLVHVDNAKRFEADGVDVYYIDRAGHNFNNLFEYRSQLHQKLRQFLASL